MIHVYKFGGAWATVSGIGYTIKPINEADLQAHLKSGWKATLEEVKLPRKKVIKDDNQE